MKVEKIPSITCDKCGSYQVILTEDGPECDECNRHAATRDDLLSLGIDIAEDVQTLKLQTDFKEKVNEAI